jgi:hypothetical protein
MKEYDRQRMKAKRKNVELRARAKAEKEQENRTCSMCGLPVSSHVKFGAICRAEAKKNSKPAPSYVVVRNLSLIWR